MQAPIIKGSIHRDYFVGENNAIIVVLDEEDQEFTRLEVIKESDTDPTGFSIFWLVPNKPYKVQIDLNKETDNPDDECHENANGIYTEPGDTKNLNGGEAITGPDANGVCI